MDGEALKEGDRCWRKKIEDEGRGQERSWDLQKHKRPFTSDSGKEEALKAAAHGTLFAIWSSEGRRRSSLAEGDTEALRSGK